MPSGAIVPFTVERELEKNPDISRADLDRLRAWLATQPHLPAEHITGDNNNMWDMSHTAIRTLTKQSL